MKPCTKYFNKKYPENPRATAFVEAQMRLMKNLFKTIFGVLLLAILLRLL